MVQVLNVTWFLNRSQSGSKKVQPQHRSTIANYFHADSKFLPFKVKSIDSHPDGDGTAASIVRWEIFARFLRHFLGRCDKFDWNDSKSPMNTNCPHCFFDRNINVGCILNFFCYFQFQSQTEPRQSSLSTRLTLLNSIGNWTRKENRNFFDGNFSLFFLWCLVRIVKLNVTLEMDLIVFWIFYLPNCQKSLWRSQVKTQ